MIYYLGDIRMARICRRPMAEFFIWLFFDVLSRRQSHSYDKSVCACAVIVFSSSDGDGQRVSVSMLTMSK